MRAFIRDFILFVLAFIVGFLGFGAILETETFDPTVPAYTVKLRCGDYLAEDSAAHLKLVSFDRDGETVNLVYRCMTAGY